MRARAQDAAPDPTTQLQNLVYYPHRGRFLFTPQFTTALQDSGSTMNDQLTTMSTQNTSYYRFSAALNYGLLDGLRLGVSENELVDQRAKSTNENTGNVTVNHSSGFSDPSFTVAERFVSLPDSGFYADLVLSATPPIGHSLSATSGQDGNNIANGWSSTASLPLYLHWRRNELELEGQLSREFGGRSSGTTPANSSLSSSYWHGNTSLYDRIHITDEWFAQPGLTFYYEYVYHTHSQAASAGDVRHQEDFYGSPSLTIGYLPVPGCLVEGVLTYITRQNESTPGSGATSEADTTQTTAALRASFQF